MPSKRNNSPEKIKVLLVDDHPMVRRGIGELVASQPDLTVCGEAASMPEAILLAGKHQPGLVIVDLSLEGNSGVELMKHMSGRISSPFLVYSMHDEMVYAERCLRAGAKGYLMKQAPPEALLTAIRHVLDGKIYLSERMSEQLLGKFVGPGRNGSAAASPIDTLSDRELEVLQLMGTGMTTAQIAEQLFLSVKTVETYREHLKQKLHVADGPKLMRYAVEWALNSAPTSTSSKEGR
jgi:DNA-binding NarL/FixJ family response regulator